MFLFVTTAKFIFLLRRCLAQPREVLVVTQLLSYSSICLSVDHHTLTSSPLAGFVNLKVLEACIRNNNEKAFVFLFPSFAPDPKSHYRLVTIACRYVEF